MSTPTMSTGESVETMLPALDAGTSAGQSDPGPSHSYFDSPFVHTSSALLLMGFIVFALMTYLIKNNKDPGEILKAFGIPLIVLSAVFVVISGFSPDQLSPVMGLLGTIAGYLLGRTEKGSVESQEKAEVLQPVPTQQAGEGAEVV